MMNLDFSFLSMENRNERKNFDFNPTHVKWLWIHVGIFWLELFRKK